jgi:hypothetical protein
VGWVAVEIEPGLAGRVDVSARLTLPPSFEGRNVSERCYDVAVRRCYRTDSTGGAVSFRCEA